MMQWRVGQHEAEALLAQANKDVETFTIKLMGEGKEGKLKLVWGRTALKAAFTAK